MRFFVRTSERPCSDPQELAAMLQFRLESIAYQQGLIDSEEVVYAFRTAGVNESVAMFESDSLIELDRKLKQDPIFPYAKSDITPVVSTISMVRELIDYLGESLLTEEEIARLHFPKKAIEDEANYWLVLKEVKPFSSLLPEEEQRDIHRRTVIAQRAHMDSREFSDDNPVGRPEGILVVEGSFEEVRRHVEDTPVFPDTIVNYTELLTLKQAWGATLRELEVLGRNPRTASPFLKPNALVG